MSPSVPPPQRCFLGWHRPAVEGAGQFLLALANDGDLASTLVVVPGGRPARLLLGRVLELAAQATPPRPMLVPPRFCTPGELPDLLLPHTSPELAPAGPLARRLAWTAALRAATPELLRHLLPFPPEPGDVRAWWHLAASLEHAHEQLAGELITFADVPRLAESSRVSGATPFPESERWRAAAGVQELYEKVLGSRALIDPMLRIVRALHSPATPTLPFDRVVLLGIPDLGLAARGALAAAAVPIHPLIFAPADLAERFDDLGTIIPEAWADVRIDIPEPLFADSPADQAEAALAAIAALGGRFAPHEISIGTPDDEVAHQLERAAEQAAAARRSPRGELPTTLRLRSAAGAMLTQSPPLRLLRAVRDLLHEPSFGALAALVRHPDVERILLSAIGKGSQTESWLDALDRYQSEHIPLGLPQNESDWCTDSPRERARLAPLLAHIHELMGELSAAPPRRPLSDWAAPLRAFMAGIHSGLKLGRNDPTQRPTIEGNIAIRDVLVELERTAARPVPRSSHAGELLPVCTAAEAIDLLLDLAGAGTSPEEGDEDTIELLGWLELPLDPAPALIVTGLNDGIVPANTAGDAFLPDSLREALGLPSNRRRFARDLFNLAALAGTRDLTLIAGRRSADNTPLAPSRLLFACDSAIAVERIRRFTGVAPSPPAPRLARRTAPADRSGFTDMPIVPVEPITSLRITAFRDFLASPYLFYLKHVLQLQERSDTAVELDPLAWGNLLHECLERFGTGDARASDDAAVIEACLLDHLSTIALQRFGREPGVCIWLQLEFARRRLREFAHFQAQRRRDGWIIEHVEWKPEGGIAPFEVDGHPFGLRGKIDRIERHETSDRWAVLDYKTGETVDPPDKAHRSSAGWRDLQLPLYRHLASALQFPEDPAAVTLGYIPLPRKPGEVRLLSAAWTADDLREADETARAVIRRIREEDFHHLGERPPEEGTFAALCGVGFIGARRHREPGEGDDA